MSFSGTSIGGWYLLVQGFAITAWWMYLAFVPDAERLFIPPGASRIELAAFRWPDLLVAAPTSIAAGVAILRRGGWTMPLAWLSAGAINYGFFYCLAWSILRQGAWLNVALMAPAALLSIVSALDVSDSAVRIFRPATKVSPTRNLPITLGQIALFWSFFLFVVPAAVVYVERQLPWVWTFDPMPVAALILFAACSALGLTSGLTMAARGAGTPLPFVGTNRLVTDGPYAHVRNPMVMAGLGQGVAVALWLGSWALVAYVLMGGAIWQFLVRPAEEHDLRTKFGDDFDEYCSRVRCWIPSIRPRYSR